MNDSQVDKQKGNSLYLLTHLLLAQLPTICMEEGIRIPHQGIVKIPFFLSLSPMELKLCSLDPKSFVQVHSEH